MLGKHIKQQNQQDKDKSAIVQSRKRTSKVEVASRDDESMMATKHRKCKLSDEDSTRKHKDNEQMQQRSNTTFATSAAIAATATVNANAAANINWHALESDKVLHQLGVDLQAGLPKHIAAQRLRQYGLNQLITFKPPSVIARFFRQFKNILIYMLLLSAGIAIALTRWIDASVILGVVVLNALVGVVQEGKAEKALAAIRDMLAPVARVIRDSKRISLAAARLVPGDIVVLERGDKVPADLRLIETRRLQIQESILTGESQPAEKMPACVAATVPLAERTSMAYNGTIITSGSGLGVVVATGLNTEVGKISEMLSQVEAPITPLLQQMNRFSYWLTFAILLAGGITFAVGALVFGDHSPDMFMAIVGLIVAAVPEGMPPILTIILAIGVTRMVRRQAIIRYLPAVETMGSVTTICSDKTGTLTCNELEVEDLITARGHYNAAAEIVHVVDDDVHSAAVVAHLSEHRDLQIALIAGVLCNDADLTHVGESGTTTATMANAPASAAVAMATAAALISAPATTKMRQQMRGQNQVRDQQGRSDELDKSGASVRAPRKLELYGDPLDQALLLLAHKNSFDVDTLKKANPRTDLIPYESEHRLMATMHHDHEQGKTFIYVKGAAEHILSMCKSQYVDGPKAKGANTTLPLNMSYWRDKTDALAYKGEKVIAIAYKEVANGKSQLSFADIKNLTMVALFGIIDPPREEAAAAVAECHSAGVRVKMITGDHTITAQAIAREVGIGGATAQRVLTGNEIDKMDDEELARAVLDVDIYARTSPEHKLRLVKALQYNNQIVAMTGDGVNDAPALRQADIGVAMGGKGTEIAKEAAAMVLADDNFATIVHAVEEGRKVYESLKKAILYVLPTSIAQGFAIVVAIFLGWQPPITAVQILWVNMVTTVTLCLSLGFERPMTKVMLKPPRAKDEPILSWFLGWRVAFVSLLFVLAIFILFAIERNTGSDLITMRTVAVNMIVVGGAAYLLNCRSVLASALNWRGVFGSKPMWIAIALVVVLQLFFTYTKVMQHFFGADGLNLLQWARIAGSGVLVFLLVEAEKWLLRWLGKDRVKI
jgi:P-type E1-E2 ATPase